MKNQKYIKSTFFFVFDKYFGDDWLLEVDLKNDKIIWNHSLHVPDKVKNVYLNLYKDKIIDVAKS